MNQMNLPINICKRFWSKVNIPKDLKNECWEYVGGARDKDGYGVFTLYYKQVKAHRVAYEYYNGSITNECVMHTCDNPACCNPHHLVEGTLHENNTDRSLKGRTVNGNAKLTVEDVKQIKTDIKLGYSNNQVARRNGTSKTNVSRIRNGKIWSEVTI